MAFTIAERLLITLACEALKPVAERELEPDFISEMVAQGQTWAIAWRYPGLNLDVPTPASVSEVLDVLEMWDQIEYGLEALDADQTQALSAVSPLDRFPGFDANTDMDRYLVARILVRDLERYTRFADRDLNSHAPLQDAYDRMLTAFRPGHEARVGGMTTRMSADEIGRVLGAALPERPA